MGSEQRMTTAGRQSGQFPAPAQAAPAHAGQRLRRPLLIAGAAMLGAIILLAVFRPASGDAASSPLHAVQRMPLAITLHEMGAIEALYETPVLTRFSGDIVWKTEDGKLVEKDDPVVRFDTKAVEEDIEAREKDVLDKKEAVRQARARVTSTEERYKAVVRQAEIQLGLARLDKDLVFNSPTTEEKLEADLSLKSATLELERADLEMRSYDELARHGFVAEAKLKEKQLDLATKTVNHAKAKLIRDLTMMGNTEDAKRVATLAVADAQKKLNISRFNRESDLAVARADLELAEVSLRNSERELKRRRDDLNWATVRAPVRGHMVFTEVYKGSSKTRSPIEVGESRTAGADLGVICDSTALKVGVWINESDVRNLEKGQPAIVTLPALPGQQFRAVISELAVLATDKNAAISSLALRHAGEAFVNVVQAKLDFVDLPDEARRRMRVGFTADVYIETAPASAALTVPWSAVRYDAEGRPYAEVAAGRSRERRPVKLGRSDTALVEVLDGLKEGEKVYELTAAAAPGRS
jgi:multidrug efflux pump subunit AcrA (membrane-fusion protein)